MTLYNSFVMPYLTYGVEVWGSAAERHINNITLSQKKIVRIISSNKARDHTKPIFKSLKILPFPKLYESCILKTMFKYQNNLIPVEINDLFITNDDIHTHYTRHRRQLNIPIGRTTMIHKTFRFKGVHYWNTVAGKINVNCSLLTFKHNIKEYLLKEI